MGIVNVTPDSFSGDGVVAAGDAVERAVAQCAEGADLLDFGGESTRPGHDAVEEAVELARVIPAIERTRALLTDTPISVDTYKPNVARAAHAAGADIVNSIWGLSDALLETAAELSMPVIAMHNQSGTHYDGGVMDSVVAFLQGCADRAMRRGIAPRTHRARSRHRLRKNAGPKHRGAAFARPARARSDFRRCWERRESRRSAS